MDTRTGKKEGWFERQEMQAIGRGDSWVAGGREKEESGGREKEESKSRDFYEVTQTAVDTCPGDTPHSLPERTWQPGA